MFYFCKCARFTFHCPPSAAKIAAIDLSFHKRYLYITKGNNLTKNSLIGDYRWAMSIFFPVDRITVQTTIVVRYNQSWTPDLAISFLMAAATAYASPLNNNFNQSLLDVRETKQSCSFRQHLWLTRKASLRFESCCSPGAFGLCCVWFGKDGWTQSDLGGNKGRA